MHATQVLAGFGAEGVPRALDVRRVAGERGRHPAHVGLGAQHVGQPLLVGRVVVERGLQQRQRLRTLPARQQRTAEQPTGGGEVALGGRHQSAERAVLGRGRDLDRHGLEAGQPHHVEVTGRGALPRRDHQPAQAQRVDLVLAQADPVAGPGVHDRVRRGARPGAGDQHLQRLLGMLRLVVGPHVVDQVTDADRAR